MKNKVFSLDQTTIKKLLTTYKLKIPDFQRSFVWKKQKKVQLLESLFKGFPIGAITLYKDVECYYIIDGLQRINTLTEYLTNPNSIISFRDYYKEIADEIEKFILKNRISINMSVLKKHIKLWYENLNSLYEFEKFSLLFNYLQQNNTLKKQLDIELVEALQEILVKKIRISDEDIAIIIYSGDKDNLPELFKNINTGSVGLSQYEILQSVWFDYYLDTNILIKTYEGFIRELELIKDKYEIDAVKEQGQFDIFKNMIGLNNIICSIKGCDILFTTFKSITNPVEVNGSIKYYNNDSVSFELVSTILYKTSNQIVKVMDIIFNSEHSEEEISHFFAKINQIILEAIYEAINQISSSSYSLSNSKYHALYVVAGLVFSNYEIDSTNLSIVKVEQKNKIRKLCLDFQKQTEKNWFIDENRQLTFFKKKIRELK